MRKPNLELFIFCADLNVQGCIDNNKKLPSQYDKNNDIKILGRWLSNQKQNYKNNKKIMKDENIRKQWEDFLQKYKI